MAAWRVDANNDWSKASVYVQYTCAKHGCRFAVTGKIEGADGEYPYCGKLDQVGVILAFEEGGCRQAEVGGREGTMTKVGFVSKG